MPDIVSIDGKCAKCDGTQITCKYNHFLQGDLEIHSWEHKCLDCGARQTTAYRSDDEDETASPEERRQCPYCQRSPS